MLHLVNFEEIKGLLLCVPGFIHDFERRDPKFTDAVKAWLTQVEHVLLNNRMAVAAEVAVLRGVLISAERGVLPPGLVFTGRTTARKIKDASAVDVLRKAEELISAAIRRDVERFTEGERLIQQIVIVAQRKGLIPPALSVDKFAEELKAIWHAMIVDPDLGPATVHLAGLVGTYDALILLDRMLPSSREVMFTQLKGE